MRELKNRIYDTFLPLRSLGTQYPMHSSLNVVHIERHAISWNINVENQMNITKTLSGPIFMCPQHVFVARRATLSHSPCVSCWEAVEVTNVNCKIRNRSFQSTSTCFPVLTPTFEDEYREI